MTKQALSGSKLFAASEHFQLQTTTKLSQSHLCNKSLFRNSLHTMFLNGCCCDFISSLNLYVLGGELKRL